jgi:hypothetical protein
MENFSHKGKQLQIEDGFSPRLGIWRFPFVYGSYLAQANDFEPVNHQRLYQLLLER